MEPAARMVQTTWCGLALTYDYMEVIYAEDTSVIRVDDRRRESWRVGIPAAHGAIAHCEGTGAKAVSVSNRRGTSRYADDANEAERIWIKRVGAGSSLDGKHDGTQTDF